jgi:hypothetical protein
VAGSCEHGNEPSGSIECGEFLDWLSILVASQEGLCSMELGSFECLSCSVKIYLDHSSCIFIYSCSVT